MTRAAVHRSLLERVVSPALEDLTPATAKALLRMKLSRPDVARVRELSSLARKGALSDAEREELDLYLRIGNLLMLMKSRARVALRGGQPRGRRKSA